jgi:hypothetical protein
MLNFIFKMIFIQFAASTSFTDHSEDQILTRCIVELSNEKNLQNWMELHKIKSLGLNDLLKRILIRIKDVLLVINTEEYAEIKYFIMKSNIYSLQLSCPYFVSEIVIEVICSIIKVNDIQNKSNSKAYDLSNFQEDVLFDIYNNVYKALKWNIKNVAKFSYVYRYKISYNEFADFKKYVENIDNGAYYTKLNVKIYLKTIDRLRDSINVVESILPPEKNIPVCVKAHSKGFKKSIKSFSIGTDRIRSKIFSKKMQRYMFKCFKKEYFQVKVNIKEYMKRPISCNKAIANIMVSLYHCYSEVNEIDTKYEIILKDDGEYQLTWSFNKLDKIDIIKQKVLQQKLINFDPSKIYHKFGFMVNYDIQYSTKKSEETENEPIKTRLILLTCMHQLGLDLIDEFFEYSYDFGSNSAFCHICRIKVKFLGSYDAVIYKCR